MILVGDNEQLQSIEAGGSFRGIIQRTGYVELAEVRRQHIDWQKQATVEFSGKESRQRKPLKCTRTMDTSTSSRRARSQGSDAERWAEQQLSKQKHETSLMMAYTNKDVHDLNQEARQYRKLYGELRGPEHTFMTEKGREEILCRRPDHLPQK